MSVFDLAVAIPSNTGGAAAVDYVRIVPEGGSLAQQSGQYVGSNIGTTTFNIPASKWISPAMSTFVMTLEVGKINVSSQFAGVDEADYVALCDNFVDTFFTQIQCNLNGVTLESIMFPHIVSTTCQYANATKNYNNTLGTMSGVGVPFMTRYKELLSNRASSTAVSTIEVEFRPPAGFWNMHKLPPGISSQTIFNWSTDPQCFESPLFNVPVGTSPYQYNLRVTQFVLNLATLTPAPGVPLPKEGLITLTSATCIRNNGTSDQLNVPVTAPRACNRVMVALQDTNSATSTNTDWFWSPVAATLTTPGTIKVNNGNGPFPATNFTNYFSPSGSFTYDLARSVKLKQIQIQAGSRAIQPSPVYNFSSGERDKKRAFSDLCNITQGSGRADSGALEYGSDNYTMGIPIIAPCSSGATNLFAINDSIEDAPELPKIRRKTTVGNASSTGAATSANWPVTIYTGGINGSGIITPIKDSNTVSGLGLYSGVSGWAGRHPFYAFDIVRQPGEECGTIQLNVVMEGTPASFSAYTTMLFDIAVQVQEVTPGQYTCKFFDVL